MSVSFIYRYELYLFGKWLITSNLILIIQRKLYRTGMFKSNIRVILVGYFVSKLGICMRSAQRVKFANITSRHLCLPMRKASKNIMDFMSEIKIILITSEEENILLI